MARKKVSLKWISNASTRRATYKKRCKGLMKKTSELATLCGVKACVVVYGEEGGAQQPEVWPSPPEARRVLQKFKAMPEIGRFKKAQSQEDLIQSRISKLRDQVGKLDLANREHETSRLLHESMDGRRPGLVCTNVEELANLRWMVETKMARVKELLQQQIASQVALPKHPASSSAHPQASYAAEMQALAESEDLQPLQQDWPTYPVPTEGELLGDVVCNAIASTSNGCASPSSNGGDMTQTPNLDFCSGFPWAQDVFPLSPME
ncbi:agamous-like MADS-box protein AGL80 [Panicum miliaceum]|uniref:Agamous-like MADS-box protein AGL80 n=1 Tax=Panicum miliaceum TaxID=4540 RepID=A0A3L6R2G6_PANMI|nr:agamous-like MADS-box protein AGL80 [Panicum miliaceum]